MPTDLSLRFDPSEVFTFLFVTLGPLRLLGPFAKLTRGLDEPTIRKTVGIGTLTATIALLIAAVLGSRILDKWHVSIGALAVAGGIVLFCVALPTVLGQTNDAAAATTPANPDPRSTAEVDRVLVPTIVSPSGVAVLVIFISLFPDKIVTILGMLLFVIVLDYLAMIFARPILRTLGRALQILGMVLGVLQVALSVQVFYNGIRFLIATSHHG